MHHLNEVDQTEMLLLLLTAAFSDQALDATMQAMDASMRAEAAAGMVGGIIDQLPMLEELVTTRIPEGVMEANRNIDEIQPQST